MFNENELDTELNLDFYVYQIRMNYSVISGWPCPMLNGTIESVHTRTFTTMRSNAANKTNFCFFSLFLHVFFGYYWATRLFSHRVLMQILISLIWFTVGLCCRWTSNRGTRDHNVRCCSNKQTVIHMFSAHLRRQIVCLLFNSFQSTIMVWKWYQKKRESDVFAIAQQPTNCHWLIESIANITYHNYVIRMFNINVRMRPNHTTFFNIHIRVYSPMETFSHKYR